MKKIITLLLTATLTMTALAGCSTSSNNADNTASSTSATTQETESTKTEQTQTEKALALIDTFATGDTDIAKELLAEDYIQHNLAYGTGRDAFISSVEYLASADEKTTVENIRAFEDGDKVFLQTVYNFAGAGEQVAFDIFRFDNEGKIAEHWDNLAAKTEPNPSGHTQIDGTMEVTDLDKTEENRKGGDKKMLISWASYKGADGYDCYWSYCNGKQNFKKFAGVKASKYRVTHKNLKNNREYKYFVAAYKMVDGKKVYLAKSNQLLHADAYRYYTSDKNVAYVSKKGKIKAVKKGKCVIYVLANNGVYRKIKVIVK